MLLINNGKKKKEKKKRKKNYFFLARHCYLNYIRRVGGEGERREGVKRGAGVDSVQKAIKVLALTIRSRRGDARARFFPLSSFFINPSSFL